MVGELRASHDIVVADVGRSLEPAGGGLLGGSGRHVVARQLVGEADAVIAVAAPTPVGVARLLDWLADVRSLTRAPVHLVVNHVARRGFDVREVEREVLRAFPAAAVWPVRANADVVAAAWQGELVCGRGFRRDVEPIARAVASAARAACT
jgi:MinD superfamily P-loop ATPase